MSSSQSAEQLLGDPDERRVHRPPTFAALISILIGQLADAMTERQRETVAKLQSNHEAKQKLLAKLILLRELASVSFLSPSQEAELAFLERKVGKS